MGSEEYLAFIKILLPFLNISLYIARMVRVNIDREHPTGYTTLDGYVEIKLPNGTTPAEDNFMRIINRLLAKQRKMAWDHEARDNGGKGKMFFGAAIVATEEGKYYMSANTHLHNSPATRNCAEAMAATEAAQEVRAGDLEITELWFMGGNGDVSNKMDILPDQLGVRNSPCGSCLDVIYNHRLTNGVQTQVHMLPLNNGEWELIEDSRVEQADLKDNQIMTRTIEELFPHVTVLLEDRGGKLKQDIAAGMDFLKDQTSLNAIEHAYNSGEITHLREMEEAGATPKELEEEVNKVLLDTMKSEYHHDSRKAILKGSIAIVRNDQGEYFLGSDFNDGEVLSTPSGIFNAIQNTRRNGVTDVFVMQLDFRESQKKNDPHPDSDVSVRMPDGETRMRIKKSQPKQQWQNRVVKDFEGNESSRENGPNVHVFLPNNRDDFDPEKHVISKTAAELLPYAFNSPKMDDTPAK